MDAGCSSSSSGNRTLSQAKRAKQDEFYTQMADIANELRHYRKHLEGKTVLCNCDDPYESNFFKYFALNFNDLKLKKLIATTYAGSPVVGGQLPLFEIEGLKPKSKEPYAVEIVEVPDLNKDGAIDEQDIKLLLKRKANVARPLMGNGTYPGGDFRSKSCLEMLEQADVVVTNPPFSLFREYVAQLVAHKKKFLIIGNTNAVTYKEIFPLIKDRKLWIGCTKYNVGMFFEVPAYWEHFHHIDKETGKKIARVSTSCWFTNMDHAKRHEEIKLFKKYSPAEYPTYDNYDAIEVGKVADIPEDYDGMMGVPVTFLDKYNPDQFRIVGCFEGGTYGEELGAKHSIETSSLGRPVLWNGPIINQKRMYKRLVVQRKRG